MINAVTEDIVHAANACAENLPPQESEFEFAGLTPAFLSARAPHVGQSPLRFECQVENEIAVGGSGPGAAALVIVSVTRAYVAKAMYRGKGQLDIAALRLIGRSSVDQYLVPMGSLRSPGQTRGRAMCDAMASGMRPNYAFERSGCQRCCRVSMSLRSSAPAQRER